MLSDSLSDCIKLSLILLITKCNKFVKTTGKQLITIINLIIIIVIFIIIIIIIVIIIIDIMIMLFH